MHTIDSDGNATMLEMLQAARASGHGYVAFTDHSKGLPIANGMDEERLRGQEETLREANAAVAGEGGDPITGLHGIEMNQPAAALLGHEKQEAKDCPVSQVFARNICRLSALVIAEPTKTSAQIHFINSAPPCWRQFYSVITQLSSFDMKTNSCGIHPWELKWSTPHVRFPTTKR